MADAPIGSRWKGWFGIVRGIGGGKTKLLEEERRVLWNYPSTLVLSATFNNLTVVSSNEMFCAHRLQASAIALVMRWAVSCYGLPLHVVHTLAKEKLSDLPTNFLPEELLKCMIELLREQYTTQAGVEVRRVVILVDEAVKLTEEIEEYWSSPDEEAKKLDYFKALRDQLDFVPGLSIVVSSLKMRLRGVTDSGRPTEALLQATQLDEDCILDNWWEVREWINPEGRSRLRVVASMLNTLPRVVELASDFVHQHRHKNIGAAYTAELLTHLEAGVRKRYKSTIAGPFPSPHLLFSAIYGENAKVNEEMVEMVRTSVFTNVIDDLQLQHNGTVNPELNILFVSLLKARTFHEQLIQQQMTRIKSSAFDHVRGTEQVGDVLELQFEALLLVRIAAAAQARRLVTLADLLGLCEVGECELDAGLSQEWGWLAAPIDLSTCRRNSKKTIFPIRIEHRGDLAETKHKFLEEIRRYSPTHQVPVRVLKANPRDSFDYLIMKYNPDEPDKPQYLLLDMKSGTIVDDPGPPQEQHDPDVEYFKVLPSAGQQYETMHRTFQAEAEKGTFLYLYFTTHESGKWSASYHSEREHVAITGCMAAQRFFGAVWGVHQAFRRTVLTTM